MFSIKNNLTQVDFNWFARKLSSMEKDQSIKKRKILYAEDQEAIARLVEYKLSQEGFEVIILNNGGNVVEKVKELKPDLILLDLMLPIKDGVTILEELKSNKDLKNIPVIMLSIQGEEQKIGQAQRLGVIDYIQKPFSIHELSERIHKALA